jgi:hypothetical protein
MCCVWFRNAIVRGVMLMYGLLSSCGIHYSLELVYVKTEAAGMNSWRAPWRPRAPSWRTTVTYILTCLLTPRSKVLLEKLSCFFFRLVKVPAIYGNRSFITAFKSAHNLSSPCPHPTSWWSILILSFHLRLGLPSGFFPQGFTTKHLYAPVLIPIRATCRANLLDLITRIIFGRNRCYRL